MDTSTSTGPIFVCFRHWRLPAEEVRARKTPESKAMLETAYEVRTRGERPLCMCIGEPGLKLEIRQFDLGEPFAARWKGERQEHAALCPFSAPSHGGEVERIKAAPLEGGGLNFRIRAKLTSRARAEDALPNSTSDHTGAQSTTTPAVEMIGMVHDMFEHLKLDFHGPAILRTHSSVLGQLQELVAKSIFNKRRMSDCVHLARRSDDKQAWGDRVHKFDGTGGRRHRQIVIGEIASPIRRSDDGATLAIHGVATTFHLTTALVKQIGVRFRSAWCRAIAKNLLGESRVLAVLVVGRNAAGDIEVLECCLCLMSRHYIVCDSFNEVRVANLLVHQRRMFRKPLSNAVGEQYRADFELLDVGHRWVMEVWGRDDPDYLAQKAAKILYWLKEAGARLWQWEPRATREKIRSFPTLAAMQQQLA